MPSRASSRRRSYQAAPIQLQAAATKALFELAYLNAEQAAFVAQVSPSAIRRACGEGLPHVRVGRKLIRIAPDDLRAWLRAGNAAGQTA